MSAVLTVEEAAQRLKCSSKTVRRLVKGGQLPALYIGSRVYRITEEALERFIAAGQGQQTPPARPQPTARSAPPPPLSIVWPDDKPRARRKTA